MTKKQLWETKTSLKIKTNPFFLKKKMFDIKLNHTPSKKTFENENKPRYKKKKPKPCGKKSNQFEKTKPF